MSDRSFIELALNGDVLPDEIDDFIDAWHEGSSKEELHEFLGMTLQEYTLWVSNPELIQLIIAARHRQEPILSAVNDNLKTSERIAARSDQARKIAMLRKWIEQQVGNSARY